MLDGDYFSLVLIFLLLTLSGFFSSSEAAFLPVLSMSPKRYCLTNSH